MVDEKAFPKAKYTLQVYYDIIIRYPSWCFVTAIHIGIVNNINGVVRDWPFIRVCLHILPRLNTTPYNLQYKNVRYASFSSNYFSHQQVKQKLCFLKSSGLLLVHGMRCAVDNWIMVNDRTTIITLSWLFMTEWHRKHWYWFVSSLIIQGNWTESINCSESKKGQ